jgi:hypothetical protein
MTKEEEWKRLEALIVETKRCKKIAEAQNEFESFQRRLRLLGRNNSKSKSKSKPLPEEIMIERGILGVKKMETIH